MAKLLRYIVHTLEIFMWEQDYCQSPDEDDFFTDFFSEEDFDLDDMEKNGTALPTEPEGRPSWQVYVEYSNHTVQNISSYYNYLPERSEELYFYLLEYFELEDEIF